MNIDKEMRETEIVGHRETLTVSGVGFDPVTGREGTTRAIGSSTHTTGCESKVSLLTAND